jgi:membrane protease YdiL (CAAX protease family)
MSPAPGGAWGPLLPLVAGAACVLVLALDGWLLWQCFRSPPADAEPRRWRLRHLFLAFQVALLAGVLATLPGLLALRNISPPLPADSPRVHYWVYLPYLLAQNAALAGVPLWLARRGRGAAAGLGIRIERSELILALFGAAAAVPVFLALRFLEGMSQRVLTALDPGHGVFDAVSRATSLAPFAEHARADPLWMLLFVLFSGLIGPVAEEVFFRGFVYRVFRVRWGMTAAMALSALAYAVFHATPAGLISAYCAGLALAWVLERTGSLSAPVGLHCGLGLLELAAVVATTRASG